MKKTGALKISLTSAVISILLFTTILIQVTVGGIFYVWQHAAQFKDLQIQLQQVSDQAGRHLENPLWNFDQEQIQQIVHNFMLISTVYRITVTNSSGALIFEQIRNEGGNAGNAEIYSRQTDIARNGERLGSVVVSLTAELTNTRLQQYLTSIIFSIFILAIVQTVTLYMLLRKTIIHPLKAIENYAARIGSQTTTPPEPPRGLFTKELKNLGNSITAMVVAIQDSEKSYRSIFENSLQGIFQTTPAGGFIKANPAIAGILGYSSSEELIAAATDIGRLLHGDSNERGDLLAVVENRGFVTGQELALRHKDGHTLHCLISLYAVRHEQGGIAYLEGSLIDISERKLVEAQLATLNRQLEALVEQRTTQLNQRNAELIASEERYRNLVETMQEGILVIDEECILTYVNRQMSSMLERHEDELIGKACSSFIATEHKKLFASKLKEAGGQSALKFELNFCRPDGRGVSTLVAPTTLHDGEGHYQGSFAVVTDITHLKQLQTQLLHAQKLESIGQLAAGIAHEINTPTQYVIGNARFLEEAFKDLLEVFTAHEALFEAMKKGFPTSSAMEQVEMGRKNHQLESLFDEIPGAFHDTFEGLERIAGIVGSVKRFAHPGQDATAPADLNDAIRSTITVSTNEWKYVARLETDLDPSLPLVPCNISAINQVVLNLLVNAAHAISEKTDGGANGMGTITVRTRNLGAYAEIAIADTGAGIAENIRNRVFDPFFTTKSVGKGTGQGLAIAHTIITETHQGTIDFDSEVGHGATFIIRLPLQGGENS